MNKLTFRGRYKTRKNIIIKKFGTVSNTPTEVLFEAIPKNLRYGLKSDSSILLRCLAYFAGCTKKKHFVLAEEKFKVLLEANNNESIRLYNDKASNDCNRKKFRPSD